jgi:hypothetical protein
VSDCLTPYAVAHPSSSAFRSGVSSPQQVTHPPYPMTMIRTKNSNATANAPKTRTTISALRVCRIISALLPSPPWPQCFCPCFTGRPVLSPARSRPSYCAVGPEWVAKVIESGSRRWKPHHYQLIKKQTPKRPSLLKTA